jgi:hypothetical protein
MTQSFRVPLILRGEVIDEPTVEFGGRRGSLAFQATDVKAHLGKLALAQPSKMADLYELSLADIVDYLQRLGRRLVAAENRWLQESYEMSRATSGLSDSILRFHYQQIPSMFEPEVLREVADNLVGIDYLEGWVSQPRPAGARTGVRIRAFGSRCVHVIAGNVPTVGVATLIRNALTRSDAIVKTPSNDPLTTAALVRTAIEMAPDHPVTKHISVAYWKGGDEEVEAHLYDPRRIEKIVAWGGFAGIKHITRYLQPGLDLITLDPKHSATIIGPEAFADETTLQSVARRLALDIGTLNQEGCVNARVAYVVSGTDDAGIKRANRLGELTFAALQQLPSRHSTPHKAFDPELKAEIDALRFVADEYRVYGGKANEGAVIVSQSDAPVDFARQLACRVANIVPIDAVDTAVRSVNAYTQTIGIYPDALKTQLRDRLAFQGAQRLVSLGGAAFFETAATPQDGIEPVRRMVKWIVEEETDGAALEAEAVERAA